MRCTERPGSPLDLDEFRAAGLYEPGAPNAADRRALLEFLVERGCTVEEMAAAEARGRLFALAGDRIVRPGRDQFTLAELAGKLGLETDWVRRCWRAFGLAETGLDAPVASAADIEMVETLALIAKLGGADAALGLARVFGASLARVADAESAAMRVGVRDLSLDVTGSELATATAFAETVTILPRIGGLLDTLHRHHLEVARRQFELSDSSDVETASQVRAGVGFADLTGFTELVRTTPMAKLSYLLSEFESIGYEVISDRGGRVVKFIGDAVMFVAPQPEQIAGIARALVDHPAARDHVRVRAGLAYGLLLAQDGDYFGSSVNLAARLAAAAEPGTVVADVALAERLAATGWATTALPPQQLRGYDEPVAAHLLGSPLTARC